MCFAKCFYFVVVISNEPFYKFSIPIKSEEYEPDSSNGLSCNLIFTYTSKYPDEAPVIEIEEAENFEANYELELLNHLQEQVLFCISYTLYITEIMVY